MAESDRPDAGRSAHRNPEETRREGERIQAELKGLDDGSDPFAAAVRVTRMPMIITDPRQADNPIVFANESFCRLTGYPHGEIIGRNCRFLQGPGTAAAAVDSIRAAVAGNEPLEIDLQNYRRDGSAFWNRLLIAPVHDSSGAVAYFFASQIDVTAEVEGLAVRTRELEEVR